MEQIFETNVNLSFKLLGILLLFCLLNHAENPSPHDEFLLVKAIFTKESLNY